MIPNNRIRTNKTFSCHYANIRYYWRHFLVVKGEEPPSVLLRKATLDDVDFYFQIRKLTIKPLI